MLLFKKALFTLHWAAAAPAVILGQEEDDKNSTLQLKQCNKYISS